jgi:prevent-host-death family protein
MGERWIPHRHQSPHKIHLVHYEYISHNSQIKEAREMKADSKQQESFVGFRNRRGEQITPSSVPATVAKNEFARILDTAVQGGAVVITKHDTPRAVLVSVEDFTALLQVQEKTLDTLSHEFDAMLVRMQRPTAGAKMQAAFSATPRQLGRAAVAAARKRA